MNTMTESGYTATIAYDPEIDMFRGEILGLNGGADFYAQTTAELRKEFKISLKVFFEFCEERGINPKKSYSGKLHVRMKPANHELITKKAAEAGKSINQWIVDAVTEHAHH